MEEFLSRLLPHLASLYLFRMWAEKHKFEEKSKMGHFAIQNMLLFATEFGIDPVALDIAVTDHIAANPALLETIDFMYLVGDFELKDE